MKKNTLYLCASLLLMLFVWACSTTPTESTSAPVVESTAGADSQTIIQLGCQLPPRLEVVQHLAVEFACKAAADSNSTCITTTLDDTCQATVTVSTLPEGYTEATLTLSAMTMGEQPTEIIPSGGMTTIYPRGTMPTGIQDWTCVQSGEYMLCNPLNLDFIEILSN